MIYTFKCLKCGKEKELLVPVIVNTGEVITLDTDDACMCGGRALERVYSNKCNVRLEGCSHPSENG